MLVTENLTPETIEIQDRAASAEAVISNLSAKLAAVLAVDGQRIEQAIVAREKARTTAFTNGAAIPHCRLPRLKRFGIAMMILQEPVTWDAEGHGVDAILMIAGPPENVAGHLRILANSSQLLDSAALRAKLKSAPGPEEAHRLLIAAEEAVEHRRSQDGMLRELRGEAANGSDQLADVVQGFNW